MDMFDLRSSCFILGHQKGDGHVRSTFLVFHPRPSEGRWTCSIYVPRVSSSAIRREMDMFDLRSSCFILGHQKGDGHVRSTFLVFHPRPSEGRWTCSIYVPRVSSSAIRREMDMFDLRSSCFILGHQKGDGHVRSTFLVFHPRPSEGRWTCSIYVPRVSSSAIRREMDMFDLRSSCFILGHQKGDGNVRSTFLVFHPRPSEGRWTCSIYVPRVSSSAIRREMDMFDLRSSCFILGHQKGDGHVRSTFLVFHPRPSEGRWTCSIYVPRVSSSAIRREMDMFDLRSSCFILGHQKGDGNVRSTFLVFHPRPSEGRWTCSIYVPRVSSSAIRREMEMFDLRSSCFILGHQKGDGHVRSTFLVFHPRPSEGRWTCSIYVPRVSSSAIRREMEMFDLRSSCFILGHQKGDGHVRSTFLVFHPRPSEGRWKCSIYVPRVSSSAIRREMDMFDLRSSCFILGHQKGDGHVRSTFLVFHPRPSEGRWTCSIYVPRVSSSAIRREMDMFDLRSSCFILGHQKGDGHVRSTFLVFHPRPSEGRWTCSIYVPRVSSSAIRREMDHGSSASHF
ncbi:hypothetical protein ACOMHN_055207 [Nucella lapillus]